MQIHNKEQICIITSLTSEIETLTHIYLLNTSAQSINENIIYEMLRGKALMKNKI
jgi:hypothetical protein